MPVKKPRNCADCGVPCFGVRCHECVAPLKADYMRNTYAVRRRNGEKIVCTSASKNMLSYLRGDKVIEGDY